MSIITVSTILLFFLGVESQRIIPGQCPDYSPIINFELEKFLGSWVELTRYPQIQPQSEYDCVKSEYTTFNETHLKFSDTMKILPNNKEEFLFESSARLADPEAEPVQGHLIVQLESSSIDVKILATDYITYAAVWSCNRYSDSESLEYFWLLIRLS